MARQDHLTHRLRTPLTIYAPSESVDSYGGQTVTFSVHSTPFGTVTPKPKPEMFAQGQMRAVVDWQVVIRYDADVIQGYRIITPTSVLDVTSVQHDVFLRWTTLTCTEFMNRLGSDNTAPVLSAIGAKSVVPDAALSFVVAATDADGDTVTYAASGLPLDSAFNEATGQFLWVPDSGDHGTTDVTFTAHDGRGGTDSETVTITINTPPVLASIGAQAVTSGDTLEFTIAATDADGDDVTYSATGLPAGATLDTVTGEFEWIVDDDDIGDHEVTFIATDDYGSTDSETVTITVSGMLRYGLVFDGVDDKAILPGFDAAAGGNALTFCMWVYARRNDLGFIFDGVTDGGIDQFACFFVSGRVRWTWASGKTISSTSSDTFPADQWVHLAVTYSCASTNGGVYKMYWNGVETDCGYLTYPPSWLDINDVATFYVGSRGTSKVFDGKIVDLRFIPATLSQAQVQAVMAGGDYVGATGHYLWQHETGQVVYDLSGNGHDGYLGSTSGVDTDDPTWMDPGLTELPTEGT